MPKVSVHLLYVDFDIAVDISYKTGLWQTKRFCGISRKIRTAFGSSLQIYKLTNFLQCTVAAIAENRADILMSQLLCIYCVNML